MLKLLAKIALVAACLMPNLALACAADGCSAHCTPGISYACGGGCISVTKNCHKPNTSACNTPKPAGATGAIFKTPKFIKATPVVQTPEAQ